MDKRSTQPLKDALAIYDAGTAERDMAWEQAGSADAVAACVLVENVALHKVRLVFAELTSDRNSYSSAMLVDIQFMRKIAALNEI